MGAYRHQSKRIQNRYMQRQENAVQWRMRTGTLGRLDVHERYVIGFDGVEVHAGGEVRDVDANGVRAFLKGRLKERRRQNRNDGGDDEQTSETCVREHGFGVGISGSARPRLSHGKLMTLFYISAREPAMEYSRRYGYIVLA